MQVAGMKGKRQIYAGRDYDPETKPQNVQGIPALADQTDENMGGNAEFYACFIFLDLLFLFLIRQPPIDL